MANYVILLHFKILHLAFVHFTDSDGEIMSMLDINNGLTEIMGNLSA